MFYKLPSGALRVCRDEVPVVTSLLYALTDADGEIRYVGGTTVSLDFRLKKHITEAKSRKWDTHKNRWVLSILSKGEMPLIVALGDVDGHFAQAEINLIAFLRSIGTRLTNGTDGGQGSTGYKHSPEKRGKISAGLKGKSSHNKGKPMSEEQKKKIAASNTGKPGPMKGTKKTAEQIEVLKLAQSNRSAETRERMGASRRGKRLSAATREKMSMATRGRKQTAEVIARRVAGHAATIAKRPCAGQNCQRKSCSVCGGHYGNPLRLNCICPKGHCLCAGMRCRS